jgi:hypothetical protein
MSYRGKILPMILFAAAAVSIFLSGQALAFDEQDPLLGVREGWAWPVVVIQPPEGWESEAGDSIKRAMRAAEREISRNREAIRGKEVTFMFSDVSDPKELPSRIATWRAMNVAAIVTFADSKLSGELAALCRERGPSLIYSGGDDAALRSPGGPPYPYLFALDLPYYARANALAEAASIARPSEQAAVMTDILSGRLARGAELTSRFLKARGMDAINISATAYRQDQFAPQIREMESGGTRLYICWLDAMATLSIWQSLTRRRNGSVVYYSGNAQKILADADGIITIDKDVLLERNEEGLHAIINMIRDEFDVIVKDPVIAAKAYSLAKWAIEAYRAAGSGEVPRIALELGRAGDIPLMGETLSIDPRTHRPRSRKYGLLRIENRVYESYGSVEVFSAETVE